MRLCIPLLLALLLTPLYGLSNEASTTASRASSTNVTAETRATVAARLREKAVIVGEFRQTRTDAKLPRPLQSSGHFVFWRGHGVHWATTSPLTQQTVYRPDTTWQMDDGPASARELRSRSDDIFRSVLLDVLSFDEAKLAAEFQPQWQVSDNGSWQLNLIPMRGHLARAIESVELHGDENIERIEITDTRGGALLLEFHAQHSELAVTTDSCERLFLFSAQQCQSKLTP
ncbi:MAG: hypothetical protein Hals2KO_12350 [Halioglobus sp.]